ncbi:thioredoxin family protein [Tenacibaculum maritimum]|uniref:thioredoxin family protein n=1 Tax=Tenacibaculum maritimum TaxID=107401 RepID=UPI003876F7A7
MKKLYLIFLIAFIVVEGNWAQEIVVTENVATLKKLEERHRVNWEGSFKEAKKKASKENKPILIYFSGSDWCGPCIKLDKELFHTQKFKEFAAKNFVLYLADFPRNNDLVTKEAKKVNKELSERYGQSSFPSVIIVDADEMILGEKNGTYMTEYYYPFFNSVLKKYN